MELKSVTRWFNEIEKGTKLIEGRLNIYDNLKIGDEILFICDKKQITKKVTFLHRYSNFAELLDVEGLQNVLPNVETLKEGINILNNGMRLTYK